MYNENKIAFIFCCNDVQYQKECSSYIMELDLPAEYELEILPIIGAKSMAAGYNQAIQKSDAKYKVYLHQDVFIWNKHFIYDILNIFSDSGIGMIGVLGGVNIPDDGILYPAWNVGMTYACDTEDAGTNQGKNPQKGECLQVEAIDGMLMATQYDLYWREDLFPQWDFYDISQAFEFRKKGYSVVVPHQDKPWCMHDCGRTKLQNYKEGRKILLHEYASFFDRPLYREEDFFYNHGLKQQYQSIMADITQYMEHGALKKAVQLCGQYDDTTIMDSDLSIIKKIVSVCDMEQGIYGACRSWLIGENYEAVKKRYNGLKFFLWDMERGRHTKRGQFDQILLQNQYSMPLIVMAGIHNLFHFEKLIFAFAENAKLRKDLIDLNYLEFIANQISMEEPVPFEEMKKEISDAVSINKTEEEIQELERSCRNTAQIWEEELPECRKHISRLLKEGEREKLSILLSSQEFRNKYEGVTDMMYMILVNQIYQEELENHTEYTVLDGQGSIEEMMSFIQEIKFSLWRLEFETEELAGKQLIELIRKKHISSYLLKYAVHVAAMDKVGLLGHLAALFLEENMPGMAFSMLKYADELCPGTEEILCTMADLCLQAGKKEEAIYCLQQVKQPTVITERFRKLCES